MRRTHANARHSTHPTAATATPWPRSYVWKSWEMLSPHSLRIGCCHRCEQPLRMDIPVHRVGDCAGRSPGSRVFVLRSTFPVSQWPLGLNAKLAAHSCGGSHGLDEETAVPCSLLLPRSPGEPARKNTCPPLWTSQAAQQPTRWERTMLWPKCRCVKRREAGLAASLPCTRTLCGSEKPRGVRCGLSSSPAHASYARCARDDACEPGRTCRVCRAHAWRGACHP